MSDNIYNFRAVEKKWGDVLAGYAISNDEIMCTNKDKIYYVLEMLPYPSGKLHMGHVRNYMIGDVVARFKRMLGFTVIHPIGWDSFGMPAENAAIQEGGHPKAWTNDNIANMRQELQKLAYMYDWPREISTCNSKYYAKEQEIFLSMFKHGLVYRKKSYVNWDPVDQTVLANEQVIDGRGWRSGAIVEKKLIEQWSIRITSYADELLDGLKDLTGAWPDKVLKMQENWIGKSDGAIINFELEQQHYPSHISVFTTRPDTIFGASFVAISPDHEVAQKLAKTNKLVSNFVDECRKMKTTEEALEKMEKKGVFTGLYVKHPVKNGERLPVYIANFVLIEYGTGAVFACPAHDERDFEFAKKYELSITRVIKSDAPLPYTGDGEHINSGFLNGLDVADAKLSIIAYLEKIGAGQRQTTYRLRDWTISRQRYWGCPIPVIHCQKCGIVQSEIPVLLPDDIELGCSGNPLENHRSWKFVKCPKCGDDAVRETDTLDTFFESSWYFLRYLDPESTIPINQKVADHAMPVDICIGGIEHAVLHLLYARFFMFALRDMGYLKTEIPFKSLLTQGMVCHKSYKDLDGNWVYPDDITSAGDGQLITKDGKKVLECAFEKMSKSKKNIVNPQKIIDSHGVDAVRLFIISDTPPEKDFDWNTAALDGTWRFLNHVWRVFNKAFSRITQQSPGNETLVATTHRFLKKITATYESISLNKAVALIREFFNEIDDKLESESGASISVAFNVFVKVLYPITPYIAHEMWSIMTAGGSTPLQSESWPETDTKLAESDTVTIAVQVNGKLRGTFEICKDAGDIVLEGEAMELLGLASGSARRIVVVPNRIVNIVI
ncbi:MAG: leucine--tRNA ligase [Holosporales bacterium]|jgi:leucyl-tRNA synthetase|nr:leucine--tRNA ligase [Holosporales bacterium]